MALALLQAAQGPVDLSTRLSSHNTIKLLPCCTSKETAQRALTLSSHSQHTHVPVRSPCFPPTTPACCFSSGSAGAVVQSPRMSYLQAETEGKKSLVKTVFRFETPAPLQSICGSLNTDGPDLLASCMLHLPNIQKVITQEASGGA